MAKVKITGHASGTGVFTLTSPNSNTDRTITLPDADVTLGTDATKLPLAGGTMTGTIAGFTSTGIDDNADATAMTINSSEQVGIGTASPNAPLHIEANGGGSTVTALKLSNNVGGQANTASRIEFHTSNAVFEAIDGVRTQGASGGALDFYTMTTGGSLTKKLRIQENGGISFNADTAAANALDDYEEGTHTTAITMGSGTATLNLNTLAYTKIGRQVSVSGQINISAVSSPSGTFQISLPFTVGTAEQFFSAGNYRTYSVDTPNDGVSNVIYSARGTAKASLEWSRDGASPTNENATNGGYFLIGLTYFTD